jgi:hypothetical protein
MVRKIVFESYLCIDHKESPGFTPEQAHKVGLGIVADQVGKGKKFETAMLICSHCPAQVIKRPERVRARGHCYKCDQFLCDNCAIKYKIDGICYTWKRRQEDYLETVSFRGGLF